VRWLLVASIAIAVLSVVGLTLVLTVRRENREAYATADRALVVSAVLYLGVGLTTWDAKPTLMAAAALLLVPVAAGLSVWAKRGASND